MDDAEKTQHVDGEQESQFDPDKTTVVPNTPRPAAPGPDAERTQMVSPTPPPPGPQRSTSGTQHPPAGAQAPYPPVGPNAHRPPFPPSNPAAGPPMPGLHTPQPTTPPVQHGGWPAPNLQIPNQGYPAGGPSQQVPPASYGPQAGGPPPSAPYGPGPGPGVQPPHFGTSPQPQQGYGAPDPFGQPSQHPQQYQQPQNTPPGQPGPQQPGPVQSPLQAANSALAKGGSFITRLIQRGMYGELIKNPWFQQTRQQNPNPFIYISFGIGVILSLIVGQLPGVLGALLLLVLWSGIAYTYFAIGTKHAVQWVAYGICGVGFLLNAFGAVLGILAWASIDNNPYSSMLVTPNVTTTIVVELVSAAVSAAVFAWVGITVHRTIKKLSGQG